jgi:DNA-binding LytR/AlgR family response regulator
MKVNLRKNENLKKDEFIIELQYSNETPNLQHFIDYINNYELNYKNKVIVLDDNYTLLEIEFKDIIMFYSNKKYNYCKVKDKSYRVKSKLYELEEINIDFIRISKNCIINMKHIEKFDISETGKIVVILDDLTEAIVSRRKTPNIMKYLDDRRI